MPNLGRALPLLQALADGDPLECIDTHTRDWVACKYPEAEDILHYPDEYRKAPMKETHER